jgi:hypothetical protein
MSACCNKYRQEQMIQHGDQVRSFLYTQRVGCWSGAGQGRRRRNLMFSGSKVRKLPLMAVTLDPFLGKLCEVRFLPACFAVGFRGLSCTPNRVLPLCYW